MSVSHAGRIISFERVRARSKGLERAKSALTPSIPPPRVLPVKQDLPLCYLVCPMQLSPRASDGRAARPVRETPRQLVAQRETTQRDASGGFAAGDVIS